MCIVPAHTNEKCVIFTTFGKNGDVSEADIGAIEMTDELLAAVSELLKLEQYSVGNRVEVVNEDNFMSS